MILWAVQVTLSVAEYAKFPENLMIDLTPRDYYFHLKFDLMIHGCEGLRCFYSGLCFETVTFFNNYLFDENDVKL